MVGCIKVLSDKELSRRAAQKDRMKGNKGASKRKGIPNTSHSVEESRCHGNLKEFIKFKRNRLESQRRQND